MKFTDEHIEAIKAAALPIDFGSLTIQIGATSRFLDIDVHNKIRLDKEPEQTEKPSKINT